MFPTICLDSSAEADATLSQNVHMNPIQAAANAIKKADALLIGAGAGIGVDSGLPDFRGNEGFWKAYPPFRELNISFVEAANPDGFRDYPERAWGFYGHRLNLYRNTTPHAGFELLKEWGASCSNGYFVYTSNVDGQFQQAGFDSTPILECHGSIHYLQSITCSDGEILPATDLDIQVDNNTFLATGELPHMPDGTLARPNILMFGDYCWNPKRYIEQKTRYDAWLGQCVDQNIVAIECGAGTAIPTVRLECESIASTLIRINPRDSHSPAGHISIADGSMNALQAINTCLSRLK